MKMRPFDWAGWPPRDEARWFYGLYGFITCALLLFPLIIPDGMYAFYAGLFCLPFLAAWLITAAYSLVVCIAMFGRRDWLRGAIMLFLAAIVAVAIMNWGDNYRYVADWEHFMVMRPRYEAFVARLPKTGRRFAEFNWGGMSYGAVGVVYDETDQISRPPGRQSPDWISRFRDTDILCGQDIFNTPVRAFGGHFYETSFC